MLWELVWELITFWSTFYGRLNLDVNSMRIYLHFGLTQPHKDSSRN